MTEISEAAKAKAQELFQAEPWLDDMTTKKRGEVAFARFIQQVSDAAKEQCDNWREDNATFRPSALAPFILPEPVDPLVIEAREVVATVFRENGYVGCPFEKGGYDDHPEVKVALAALKRGLKIVEASDAQS